MSTQGDSINRWKSLARQSNYQAGELARLYGTSLRQLERTFSQVLDQTPHQWLTKQKFRKARELLKRGLMVKEVSLELGFRSISNFCRAFRAYCGMSPGAAAAAARKREMSRNEHRMSRNEYSEDLSSSRAVIKVRGMKLPG